MIGTRQRSPALTSRPSALRQSITNTVAAIRKLASLRASKVDERKPVEIQCRIQPPLCKAREMRLAIERPRIPWHQHPAWTEYAMTREFTALAAPRLMTDMDVLSIMRRSGTPATDLVR